MTILLIDIMPKHATTFNIMKPSFRQEHGDISLHIGQWRQVLSSVDKEKLGKLHASLSTALGKGIKFKRGDDFNLTYLPHESIGKVLENVPNYPQLKPVTEQEFEEQIRVGLALAVLSGQNLVSYLGADARGSEKYGFWVIRSAITNPNLRGLGLFSILKVTQMLNIVLANPGFVPLAVNRDSLSYRSGSMGANERLNLTRTRISDLSIEPKSLFAEACRSAACPNKPGIAVGNPSDCNCLIWFPSVRNKWPDIGVAEVDSIKNELFDLVR